MNFSNGMCCDKILRGFFIYILFMKKILKIMGILLTISLLLSGLLCLWFPWIEAFRMVFGGVYVLFIPGLFLTYALWGDEKITSIERFVFSFTFSLALVPIFMYLLHWIGIKTNVLSILSIITTMNLVLILGAWHRVRTDSSH